MCPTGVWISPGMETLPQPPWSTCSSAVTLTVKLFPKVYSVISCTSVFSYFLLCHNWTPMRGIWVCLLYSPPWCVYTFPLSLLFFGPNNPSSLSLFSYARVSKIWIISWPFAVLIPVYPSFPCTEELTSAPRSLRTWPQQGWVGRKSHLPLPAADDFPSVAQDTVGHFDCSCLLLPHGQHVVVRISRSFSAKLLSSQLVPSVRLCLGWQAISKEFFL